MELGKQIRKYRGELNLSQDGLAERIYVSRQTISNWENDKSYPDIHSLVLLSEVFDISIDQLIKGDVEMMKAEINKEEKRAFEKLSTGFSVLFIAMMVTPVPLAHFLGMAGIAIWIILAVVTVYIAVLVERKKKQFDIQTWREIVAFSEGVTLDEIAKTRESGKRIYQKILLALGAGMLTALIACLFAIVFRVLS